MKGFLLDENIPVNLRFEASLPFIAVAELGSSPTDSKIWDHATRKELVIVTKDADFSGRMILHSPPPWVVHLKFGNLNRFAYHEFMAKVWPEIESLLEGHKLINVHLDRVEAVV